MRTWFAVENSLVDRNDLTAYEKLCGMVLARYAGRPEFDHLLTTDIIAVKMGVPTELAMNALRGLVRKGLVDVESTSDLFVEGSDNHIRDIELTEYQDENDTHIIRSYSDKAEAESMQFEALDLDNDFDDEEDELDNLDKLIAESSMAEDKNSAEVPKSVDNEQSSEMTAEHGGGSKTANQAAIPYNRGVSSYQSSKGIKKAEAIEYDVNQVSDRSEEIEEEMLSKSIHEQSDSVRAWIEEREATSPPIVKAPVTNREVLVTQVMEMIEEPINDRQARIILGLAQYDLDKVRKCYVLAQKAQVSDKIDMLIHELQKTDEPEAPKRTPRTSQVDHAKLNQMRKYQAMKNTTGSKM